MFLRIDRKTIQQMIGDKTRGTTKGNKYVSFYYILKYKIGFWVVVAVIVWQLDIQLHKQTIPITTDVVSSNLDQGEVYNIM